MWNLDFDILYNVDFWKCIPDSSWTLEWSQNVEIYFKFSENRRLLACERHEYTLWENVQLQAWVCAEQSIYDITRTPLLCGWISHSRTSRKPQVLESGFIAQTKQKINIMTDFDILCLKT